MRAGVQSDGRPGIMPTGEIELGALGRALWRRKMLIAGLTLVAAAMAFAAVNLITPRYKSEARVLIETRENIFFRPDAEKTIERGTLSIPWRWWSNSSLPSGNFHFSLLSFHFLLGSSPGP